MMMSGMRMDCVMMVMMVGRWLWYSRIGWEAKGVERCWDLIICDVVMMVVMAEYCVSEIQEQQGQATH